MMRKGRAKADSHRCRLGRDEQDSCLRRAIKLFQFYDRLAIRTHSLPTSCVIVVTLPPAAD
jgi:hypothetical protein